MKVQSLGLCLEVCFLALQCGRVAYAVRTGDGERVTPYVVLSESENAEFMRLVDLYGRGASKEFEQGIGCGVVTLVFNAIYVFDNAPDHDYAYDFDSMKPIEKVDRAL